MGTIFALFFCQPIFRARQWSEAVTLLAVTVTLLIDAVTLLGVTVWKLPVTVTQ